MIVYGEREEEVSTRSLVAEDLNEIRYGQLEAGVVDALFPDADGLNALVQELRRIAVTEDYGALRALDLPPRIRIRPQEGFAYYALYPEQYVRAARRFERERQPSRCVVVGIRSIGTTLSAAVARALECPAESVTVRPHGHPFDRRVELRPELRAWLAERAASAWFLLVDEGPGISGSSFAAVADALSACGVPDERIVFFPSYEPDVASLRSERAKARWARHAVYVEPFDEAAHRPEGALDLSGGAWRSLLGAEDVPVVPAHERRKYLHGGVLRKFSGLAHYGESRLARAERLERFVPRAIGLEEGFLLTQWVEGRPAVGVDEHLLDVMAAYLDHLGRDFRTGRAASYDKLVEMIRVNTGLEVDPPKDAGELVAVDGRMLPHEWILTAEGWKKTDALDHHDDHFFPGCQDIAWDIAGASVEFGVDAELLLRRIKGVDVRGRLGFYRTAYLAYRIGYCAMAGEEFAGLKGRYEGMLGRVA